MGSLRRRLALAAALLPALAGCCTPAVSAAPRRDSPAAAVDWIRNAFVEDRVGDQFDAFHPDMVEREGLSLTRYSLARDLHPGSFGQVAEELRDAGSPVVEPQERPLETRKGPRRWARVTMSTRSGSGVFLLVDEPSYLVVTDDDEVPTRRGVLDGGDLGARIREGRLEVSLRVPLGRDAPLDGSGVLRVELKHDWLLFGIERLDGFDELVRQASEAAADGQGERKP